MISDTLFEAAERIEDYLTDPLYHHWYGKGGDPLYDRLRAVDAEMREIVRILDTPPDDAIVINGETTSLSPSLLASSPLLPTNCTTRTTLPDEPLLLHLRGRDALTAFTDALFSAVLKSGREGLLDPTALYDRIEAALDDTLGHLWTPPASAGSESR